MLGAFGLPDVPLPSVFRESLPQPTRTMLQPQNWRNFLRFMEAEHS